MAHTPKHRCDSEYNKIDCSGQEINNILLTLQLNLLRRTLYQQRMLKKTTLISKVILARQGSKANPKAEMPGRAEKARHQKQPLHHPLGLQVATVHAHHKPFLLGVCLQKKHRYTRQQRPEQGHLQVSTKFSLARKKKKTLFNFGQLFHDFQDNILVTGQ